MAPARHRLRSAIGLVVLTAAAGAVLAVGVAVTLGLLFVALRAAVA